MISVSKGFPQDKKITYSGMLWLLAAQIIVMLPLLFHLPIWLLPVLVFSAIWRIRVMQGHLQQPGIVVKIIIAILGLAGLKLSGIPLVSLDMTASILMLGFAYKSLEVIQRRDGMVVILTGFILIGVLFLYSQSILTTLYSVLSLAVLTSAMIAIQQTKSTEILPNLRLASLMLALCLPLMILFFLFAPRFQPFWTVPTSGGHAKTGISDSMTPGDIAKLSQSDALVFSVKFLGERPKQNELYWRGLVLQHFDGATWTQFGPDINADTAKIKSQSDEKTMLGQLQKKGDEIKYEVIYQSTSQPWLFALTPVVDIMGDAIFGNDFRIIAPQDIIEPMLLRLKSFPDSVRELELSASARALALQLPEGGNQQSRLLAKKLLLTSANKQEYIEKVLNRFREQQYFYTLRPPLLSKRDSIDDFLIESKRGFCAHYAGSFVYMMRAAGIPARVVSGYQGGEWNEGGNFLSVKQFDAHAWTEVWLEGQGWVRHDPTAMVAPQRIERNLEAAVEEEGSFLEDQMISLNKIKWLKRFRKQMDSMQYAWRRFVLGYDKESQQNFLKQLLGEITIQKTAMFVGGVFGGIILLWVMFLGLARKRNNEAIEHQLYRRFCDLLEKKGIKRELSQTPESFSKLASAQLPDFAEQIRSFSQSYSKLCYAVDSNEEKQTQLEQMRKILKAF